MLLEGLEQTSETQQTAKDLVEALQRKDILKHKDRVSNQATNDSSTANGKGTAMPQVG